MAPQPYADYLKNSLQKINAWKSENDEFCKHELVKNHTDKPDGGKS